MKKNNTEKKTVAIATLGCKVNQFESASIQNGFEEKGLEITPFSGPADIYVINTCAVTAKASAQSRQTIRKAMRGNPNARIVVTGCYAQVESGKIKEITGDSSMIVANDRKNLLVETALTIPESSNLPGDIRQTKTICNLPVKSFGGRSRPFLKIQDGCNNFCTYCIVPLARGRSRSLPPADVLNQAEAFARAGYQEIVLTGIHVGDYGHDLTPRFQLSDIVAQLLARTPAIRYRISSLEPTEITPALLDLMASNKGLAPHLHIPLQSGDDGILKKMNRRYDRADFVRIIKEVVERMPDIAIGVDVLTGFPSEDEAAFGNTLKLVDDLPITYLHVFPYSRRPGTPAAKMPGQVAKNIKDERVALLRELDRHKRLAFYEKNLGRTREVLAEGGSRQGGFLKGFTDNYIPVRFVGPAGLANRITGVRLDKIIDDRAVSGSLQDEGTKTLSPDR